MDYDRRLPGPELPLMHPPVRTPREAAEAYMSARETGERVNARTMDAPGPVREPHPYEDSHTLDLTV